MQFIINKLCISGAVLLTLAAIPSEASDRDPKPNETSAKSSFNESKETYVHSASNYSNPIDEYTTKEEIIKSSKIRLSEK